MMIDDQTLLPPNATSAERALEMATRVRDEVHAGADTIASLKEAPPEAFLLWLVWEYGLEELLPFLPNAREVIAQGLQWDRIKGTPESLRLALSWLALGADPAIEEETPTGAHWHEFMMNPGGVPGRRDTLIGTTRMAEISAPVGTSLARIFHGYDVRRFILDGSAFGDLLSDYSGVRDEELGVVLSFGRTTEGAAELGDASEASTKQVRRHSVSHRYDDRPLWDFSRFGDAPVRNHLIMHSHLFQMQGDALQYLQAGMEERVLPKAAVVLSDGFVLGDTNAALFAIEYREVGAPSPLSDGLALSGDPWRIERHPFDERIDRFTGSVGAYLYEGAFSADRESSANSFATYLAAAGQAGAMCGHESTSSAALSGQFWTGVTWLPQQWADLQTNVRTNHYGDPA